MMRNILRQMQGQVSWLLLLLLTDIFAGVLLWLADVRAFSALLGVLILGSAILWMAALFLTVKREKKRERIFLQFMKNPDREMEEKVLGLENKLAEKWVRQLGETLRESERANRQQAELLRDYEEYVESWAHEIKTPLSLMTFLLDNRKGGLPGNLYHRLEYVRSQIQSDVSQMLYYARLKSDTKDYQLERLSLRDCCEEALEDYRILLEEKGFAVRTEMENETVFSDRRGMVFILSQIISNAVKYAGESGHPELILSVSMREDFTELSVRDNGIGVRTYELPFVFEKGFTGDTGTQRKKATGMGLYLVKEMAEDLKIETDVRSEFGKGFEILLRFPVVRDSEC